MARRTRGEAIWAEARTTAIPEVQGHIDAPINQVMSTGEATDTSVATLSARVDVLLEALAEAQARIAGLEWAVHLAQVRKSPEVTHLGDSGVAELMDRGWVRINDSAVVAVME